MVRDINIPEGMETAAFTMGENAIAELPDFLEKVFPEKRAWIIADENTWAAAGCAAAKLLENTYPAKIYPGKPQLHPDSDYSDALAAEIAEKPDCVPVAVGSGVINDIVKRAAGLAEVRYCCVPTAASVDGYTSYGAAMAKDGFKMTLPCPAPYALLVDSCVLRDAPPEMFASGYADLFAKIPAGGDWIWADALGIEKIDRKIWDLVQKPLRSQVADPGVMEPIFAGLAATGYAMQLYRDSRPASGAEHLFSHIWEMEKLQFNGRDVSHGFKVAVGTLTSTMLMEFMMKLSAQEAQKYALPILSESERSAEIDRLLVKDCYGSGVKKLALEKFAGTAERRADIFRVWDDVTSRLPEQLYPSVQVCELFKRADVPTHFSEIGLDEEQFTHGIRTAQLIRKRYTVIDVLYDSGLLESAIRYVLERFQDM